MLETVKTRPYIAFGSFMMTCSVYFLEVHKKLGYGPCSQYRFRQNQLFGKCSTLYKGNHHFPHTRFMRWQQT